MSKDPERKHSRHALVASPFPVVSTVSSGLNFEIPLHLRCRFYNLGIIRHGSYEEHRHHRPFRCLENSVALFRAGSQISGRGGLLGRNHRRNSARTLLRQGLPTIPLLPLRSIPRSLFKSKSIFVVRICCRDGRRGTPRFTLLHDVWTLAEIMVVRGYQRPAVVISAHHSGGSFPGAHAYFLSDLAGCGSSRRISLGVCVASCTCSALKGAPPR